MWCDKISFEQRKLIDKLLNDRRIPNEKQRWDFRQELDINKKLFEQDFKEISKAFSKKFEEFVKTGKKTPEYYTTKAEFSKLYSAINKYLEGFERYEYVVSEPMMNAYGDLVIKIRNGPYIARDKLIKENKDDPDYQKLSGSVRSKNMVVGVDISPSCGGRRSPHGGFKTGVIWGYKL